MKYLREVIEAARVVIDALPPIFNNQDAGYTGRVLPAELVNAALALPKRGPAPANLIKLWNSLADGRLPRCKALTAARRRAAGARLKEFPAKADWVNFIEAINHNPWALGEIENPKYPNWHGVNFDWFIRPGSIVRFLEGDFGGALAAPAQAAREAGREELDRR